MTIRIINLDCREGMAAMDACSVDAIVTDPPYGLNFMSKGWDHSVPGIEFWIAALRVAKPGAYLLAFGGTRTFHRLAVAIEDAGWEIRDTVMWVYGSGFPKSLDVSKAIDKAAGAERKSTGQTKSVANHNLPGTGGRFRNTTELDGERIDVPIATFPATENAKQWQGWGTALKPAWEPVIMARKPLATIGINVQQVIESQLRERGVVGEIEWQKNVVQPAANRKAKSSSGLVEDSHARTADASRTESIGQRTASSTGTDGTNGPPQILGDNANLAERRTPGLGNKSSRHTAGNAPVAESKSSVSSPSIMSTEGERSTENQFTGKCTESCVEKDSLPDTESFAGIATGLTGSMAVVHINRDQSGRFQWPDGLPKAVPSSPLTVAANVEKHGTGALNIDACRIGYADTEDVAAVAAASAKFRSKQIDRNFDGFVGMKAQNLTAEAYLDGPAGAGRWPANLIHDGSDEVLAAFPDAPGQQRMVGPEHGEKASVNTFGDTGSAARFFYGAKASKWDREDGLAWLDPKRSADRVKADGPGGDNPRNRSNRNHHPTVKPTDLMRYLCRLVTPKGGTVLDPFMGSGSTLKAAELEGFSAIGIEIDAEYCAIARNRIASDAPLFAGTSIRR